MAAYCECVLYLSGVSEEFGQELLNLANPVPPAPSKGAWRRLRSSLSPSEAAPDNSQPGLFELLRPMPNDTASQNSHLSAVDSAYRDPMWSVEDQWRLEFWGCRSYLEIEEGCLVGPGQLRLKFVTHYTPPVAALQYAASERGFDFRLLYCEIGNGLVGIASRSGDTADNREYFSPMQRPPAEEGVPQELIDQFNLDEIYAAASDHP